LRVNARELQVNALEVLKEAFDGVRAVDVLGT
jgi:hypothetical protein